MGVTDEEIRYLKENIPIERVLAHYGVKEGDKRGKYFCPFGNHEDKHPSLSVKYEKNYCYCFSCNTGANPIEFVRKMEGLPFIEAVERLEEIFNIDLFAENHTLITKENYDPSRKLPLNDEELKFIGLYPYIKIYTYKPEDYETMQEEIEFLKEDYEKGLTRQDVPLATLIKWTEDHYLYVRGDCQTVTLLNEYRENPDSVVEMIQDKIKDMYSYYSHLPISAKNELTREKLEKMQEKVSDLVYNSKYQEWASKKREAYEKEENEPEIER